jgi:hypothetical protein
MADDKRRPGVHVHGVDVMIKAKFSPGDIVRHRDMPEHTGRVSAVFTDRVRVRWGAIRWIEDASASDLQTVAREESFLVRLISDSSGSRHEAEGHQRSPCHLMQADHAGQTAAYTDVNNITKTTPLGKGRQPMHSESRVYARGNLDAA